MLQLDFLRGIAILMVVVGHTSERAGQGGLIRPLAMVFQRAGWTGVDLFFVLSGFLVGGLLLRELRVYGKLDVKRFLIRRAFKIWPAYFAFIAFCMLNAMRHGDDLHDAARKFLPNILHLQSYLGSPAGHTWSLAVEEHFYLAVPLVLLLLTRGRNEVERLAAIPVIAIVLALFCLIWRSTVQANLTFNWTTHLTPTHRRVDSLFFGVMLAYFYHFRPSLLHRLASNRLLLILGGMAMIAPVFCVTMPSKLSWTVGFTLLYLGYGAILIAIVHTPQGEGWLGRLLASPLSKLIAFIGVFSYSIYLWHMDIAAFPLEHRLLPRLSGLGETARWVAYVGVYVAVACIGGAILAKLIELPSLALRERLFPARASALPRISAPRKTSEPIEETLVGTVEVVAK